MNQFERTFFKKYIPEWQVLKWVIHKHFVTIFYNLFLKISILVIIPIIMYYYSDRIKDIIPFIVFEIYLIAIYFRLILDVFNWYNDVFVITDKWIVDISWRILKTNVETIKYENIEWIWVEQDSIWDKIFKKGNIVISKIWDDDFVLFDAVIPYESLWEIEKQSKEAQKDDSKEEEKDKFELLMEALAWVMEDYLERNWTDTKKIISQKKKKWEKVEIDLDENSIDLREK